MATRQGRIGGPVRSLVLNSLPTLTENVALNRPVPAINPSAWIRPLAWEISRPGATRFPPPVATLWRRRLSETALGLFMEYF
jgi:hypothetical protein